jgi:hypothetical protein
VHIREGVGSLELIKWSPIRTAVRE